MMTAEYITSTVRQQLAIEKRVARPHLHRHICGYDKALPDNLRHRASYRRRS